MSPDELGRDAVFQELRGCVLSIIWSNFFFFFLPMGFWTFCIHNHQQGNNLLIIPFSRWGNWNHRSYIQVPSQFSLGIVSPTLLCVRITGGVFLKQIAGLQPVLGQRMRISDKSPAAAGPGTTLRRITALCLVYWQKGSSWVLSPATNQLCDLEQDIISKDNQLQNSMIFTFHAFQLFCLSVFSLLSLHI